MPSLVHHVLVDLMRSHPHLAPELLRDAAGAAVPGYHAAAVTDATLDSLQPATLQADLVIELRRRGGVVALVIALEVQLRVDRASGWPGSPTSRRCVRAARPACWC